MKYLIRSQKGFTLIELMVVISIIALITSILLVSLQNARKKGADSFVQQEIVQLRNYMELHRDADGSYYSTLNQIWSDYAAHRTGFELIGNSDGTTYAFQFKLVSSCSVLTDSQLKNICVSILQKNSFGSLTNPGLVIGGPKSNFPSGGSGHFQTFSIEAALPSTKPPKILYLCLGSSGRSSNDYFIPYGNTSTGSGCLANP